MLHYVPVKRGRWWCVRVVNTPNKRSTAPEDLEIRRVCFRAGMVRGQDLLGCYPTKALALKMVRAIADKGGRPHARLVS